MRYDMKLKDILKKENELMGDLISSLQQVKSNLMKYSKVISGKFDAEIEDIYQMFGDRSMNETFGIDKEAQLYRMMGTIDQWILSLQRLHMKKDKEEKEWFSDDELEKKQVFRVKEPSETGSE